MGITKAHSVEEGKAIRENHTMIYSGGEEHRKVVGIMFLVNIEESYYAGIVSKAFCS